MRLLVTSLCCLALAGCISKEFNVVKITEADYGKTITVPADHRLSILLPGEWYYNIMDLTDNCRNLGNPERTEKMVDGKLKQYIVVNLRVHQPGEVKFRYMSNEHKWEIFQVKVVR